MTVDLSDITYDDPLMKPMAGWWNAYFEICAVATEAIGSDAARAKADFGLLGKALRHVGNAFFKKRKRRENIRRELRAQVGTFFDDTPIKAFRSGGFTTRAAATQLVPIWDKGKPLVIIRNDWTGDQITVTGPHAEAMANFLIWFQHCGPVQHDTPNDYVIEVLAKQGITKENYRTHPESPGYNGLNMITYPWGDEEDDRPRIIVPGGDD